MATSIFSLFGEIFVENEQANKNIDETTKKGESMGDKLGKGIAAVGKTAAAVGTAAVAAGTAMFGIAQNAATSADAIDKNRQALGMSVEGYQEWAYVLGQNGADITKMGTAMKTLSTVMDGTSKSGVAALDQLGISLAGMNQEEAFAATVEALQGIEDETLKAQIAQDLYGKQYQSLMPLLNQTAEGTQDLRNRAHDLGIVLSEDAVNAGVVFGDTLDDLKQSAGAIGTQLGVSLMPIITELMGFVISNMPLIQSAVGQLAPVLVSLLSTIAPIFMQLVENLLPTLLNLFTAIMPLLEVAVASILPPILSIIEQLLPYLVQVIEQLLPPLVQLLETMLPILMPIIETILPPLLSLLDLLIAPLLQLLNIIIPPLTKVIETIAGVIQNVLGKAFEFITPLIDGMKENLSLLMDFIQNVFSGNWSAAWQNVQDIFSNIWNGMKELFKMPINWIIDKINQFLSGINNITIPDWVPLVGGASFNIPMIPRLAKGGTISNDGTVMVGEEGPELLNLPRGASVVPLNRSGAGGGVAIHINGATIMNENDVDWLMDLVIARLKQAGVVVT